MRSRKFGFLFDFWKTRGLTGVLIDFIATGYADGIITINLLEADPVTRVEQKKLQMKRIELYWDICAMNPVMVTGIC